MADINGQKISATSASPYVHYVITYTKSRPNNSQMRYVFTIKTNLNSSGSFLGTGHNLQCTMTVNGTSGSVELKNKSESWRGSDVKSTKTLTITCSSTTGNATQGVTFKVDNPYGTAGEVTNSSYTVTSSALTYTKCGAPTTFTVNKSQAAPASKVTLSWRGASAGTANAIQKYYIEYTTNGGSSWAATNPYNYNTSATSGSLTITLPNVQGATFGFRIRTEGAAGSNYYSDYKYIYNVLTTYSRPTIPNWSGLSGNCYATHSNGTTTIKWKKGSKGTNNAIVGYELWYSESTNNSTWSDRQKITYTTSPTSYDSSTFIYTWKGGTTGRYYKFCAVAMAANWEWSTTNQWGNVITRTNEYTACGAPSNLKSNITNPTIGQTITLSWTAGSAGTNNSVTGYELYYSTNGGSTYNLISSSIGASTTSYNYQVPRTPGAIRFRVRTKGSAGSSYYSSYSFSSNYQTITIQQADPPTAGTVNTTLIDYGSSGGKAFSISWAGFAGNTYNPISGYTLYYQTSKTIDDSDFGSLYIINSNLSSSTTSYTYTGGIWNNYYKFVVKAKGQYYGESPLAYSTAVQKVTDASTPPTAFEYTGSAYTIVGETAYVVPGLKIAVMPIGAANAVSYAIQYREVKNGVASSWRTISSSISLNKYTPLVKISNDLTDGDYINFRALSRNTAGDESDYFPSDSELENYKLTVKSFDKENRLHPVVQIKRANTDAWNREDNNSNGIRIRDGEFAYDTEKRLLTIGTIMNNSEVNKFSELPHLHGLLPVGTNNQVAATGSIVVGNSNNSKNITGFFIIGQDTTNKALLKLDGDVQTLTVGNNYFLSSYGYPTSYKLQQIIPESNEVIFENFTTDLTYQLDNPQFYPPGLTYLSVYSFDESIGDNILYESEALSLFGTSNMFIGRNSLVNGTNNLISPQNGSSNYILNSFINGTGNKLTYASNSIVSGSNNTTTSIYNVIIVGSGNKGSGNCIGTNNSASHSSSIVFGDSNFISSSYSLGFGRYNYLSSSLYGVVGGLESCVSGDNTISVARVSATKSKQSAIFGKCNTVGLQYKITTLSAISSVTVDASEDELSFILASGYTMPYSGGFFAILGSENNWTGRITAVDSSTRKITVKLQGAPTSNNFSDLSKFNEIRYSTSNTTYEDNFSVGAYNNSSRNGTNLLGTHLVNGSYDYGTVVGKYNTSGSYMFCVGVGSNESSRKNGFYVGTSTIYNNLDVYNNEKTWFKAETVFDYMNNFLNNTQTNFYINTSSSTSGTKLTVNYSNSVYYFYPTPTGTVRLGSPVYKWHSVYATNGTIQTSGRNDKYNIHYLENLSPKLKTLSAIQEEEKITFNDVLSFINNIKPATFIYKDNTSSELKSINDLVGTEGMSSIQLGLIADDIANDKLYKYIGVKTETTKTTNSNNEQENPAGNSSLDGEPIYGLQPLPVATLALTGCKILLQKIDQLEQEIADLKSSSL